MNQRIFIGKKPTYDVLSRKIEQEIQSFLPNQTIKVYLIYDLFNLPNPNLDFVNSILVDSVTDNLFVTQPKQENKQYFATEFLPGQYDQRADSAEQCLNMVGVESVQVRSGFLYELEQASPEDLKAIQTYLINPIESRVKDLSNLQLPQATQPKSVPIVKDFIGFNATQLEKLHQKIGFSFGLDDLLFIQTHFQQIQRNPTETELKVLDTYWSDHCRHTTFETEITQIKFNSQYNKTLEKTYQDYLSFRQALGITKPIRLMDLATIMGKYFIKTKQMNNIEVSEEVNACSIEILVDEDGAEEPWLLMFKNETHNHPTEVEPFGGASTCIGGAIRDPLSGRAYVYQAMRISGSANPLETIQNTLEGKLPQKKITTEAAKGYSSYGNQIGVATTLVKEIYHNNYKAKRMEVGFVIGAVKKNWVKRESPQPGDKIILIGGKTGRDGIGGATGSSKVHDGQNLTDLSAEVQKGNAPEERKIQRLFKRKEAIKLIKKCNDFGAGGVCVAIGEIAAGVRIDLDKISTKYNGLNGTELAISESQERMAIAIAPENVQELIALAAQENVEAVEVAEVTSHNKVEIYWQETKIVDLDREFLDTNGVRKQTKVEVQDHNLPNPLQTSDHFNLTVYQNMLKDLNHTSQKGLIEMFDSNVGRSTVLQPMGGKHQDCPEAVSIQKLPTNGFTNTVSMASYGYNPKISEWNPYFGGYFAVIDSVSRIVAAGGNHTEIRLSFQEYFERLRNEPKRWGKPFAALLGTIEAQKQLKIAAIGGKDSMSGSYQSIDVPPTLISFAVCATKTKNVRSSCLQKTNSKLVLFLPKQQETYLLEPNSMQQGFEFLYKSNQILSARTVEFGGIAESLSLMAFGNEIGVEIQTHLPLNQYFPAAIVLEVPTNFKAPANAQESFVDLGKTAQHNVLDFGRFSMPIAEAKNLWKSTLQPIFPETKASVAPTFHSISSKKNELASNPTKKKEVLVVIPVFPGTNSEYDSAKAFEREGAQTKQILIRNLNNQWLQESIELFCESLQNADVLMIPGGFSAADEPDGSGKFIASFLRNKLVKEAVHNLLAKKGLILGICNGFQALVKSGLLPYGKISDITVDSPILFHNNIGRHVAQMAKIKVVNDWSPWLSGMKNQIYWIPVSHGEGRFMANAKVLEELNQQGQIATTYVDFNGNLAKQMPENPNDSYVSIEGITSQCGLIYGRMAHPERVEEGLFKNIPNVEIMNIFKNAMDYFRR